MNHIINAELATMPKNRQPSTTPLRLPASLKDWAKAQARGQVPSMSLNGWIVAMLEQRRAHDQVMND